MTKINWIKWLIWTVWLGVIVMGAITAGGYQQIKPLYLTESGISINAPEKYLIYYIVLGIIFALSLLVGHRAFCHSICWMAPSHDYRAQIP